MKLLVEGEISATSYKKLLAKLKPLNRKQLWEVLDHYIFHVISDNDVNELLKHLEEKAVVPDDQVTASAEDDDLFYTIDPRQRFRSPIISDIPSNDSLERFKDQLDLLYDQNCFENYIDPVIRSDVASRLVAYASEANLPVLDHWREFSAEGVTP